MRTKNKKNRCKARTKTGEPCGAAAMAGGLCYFHANPKKAVELGRKGGRSNRHAPAGAEVALASAPTRRALLETGTQVLADVLSDKRDPRVASGVAPLLNFLLRAADTTDLEKSLAEMRQRLAELTENIANNRNAAPSPESDEPDKADETDKADEPDEPDEPTEA